MCPKFTWNVLAGGRTEWCLNISNMCFGPGRLALPSLLVHTKHCFCREYFSPYHTHACKIFVRADGALACQQMLATHSFGSGG